jgi:hypothetical protein
MIRLTVALAVALIALAACSSSDATTGDEAAATNTSAAPTSSSAGPSNTAKSRCLEVSAGLRDAIAQGAEDGVGRLRITEAAAVKSKDFKKAFMVAGRIKAPGVDDIGVWASNSLKPGGGIIMSVDGFAQQFTAWPDADKTDAGIRLGDDGTYEAINCLK